MTVAITVTVNEGVFVFNGERADGSASWSFLRRREDGVVRPGKPPRRFIRDLKRSLPKNDKSKKAGNARRSQQQPTGEQRPSV